MPVVSDIRHPMMYYDTNSMSLLLWDGTLQTGSLVIGQVTANAGTNLNTSALATQATLASLLTELQLKADLTETQPVGYATDTTANGSITTNAQSVLIATAGLNQATIRLTGSWSGTLTFQASVDGGSTYVDTLGVREVSGSANRLVHNSATTNGTWIVGCSPYTQVRVLSSGWASGTATVNLTATARPWSRALNAVNIHGVAGLGSVSDIAAINSGSLQTVLTDSSGSILNTAATNADALSTSSRVNYAAAALFGYNGSTFDRLRSDTTSGLDVDITRLAFATRSDTYATDGGGTGTIVDRSASPLRTYAIQVVGTGAAASLWDVRLEGSLDNVNFDQILQHTNATGDGKIVWIGTSNAPSLYFRSRAAGLTKGTATNIIVTILGAA